MLRNFANGTIEYFIDLERKIVFSRWDGDVRGDELLAVSPGLWRQHPEIGAFSAIHDMVHHTGLIEHQHGRELMRLRAERFGPSVSLLRTAIVTSDLMKSLEIKVTQVTQPDRQFRLFGNNQVALDWVTADEPGNPCAGRRAPGKPLPWWFERNPAETIVRVR